MPRVLIKKKEYLMKDFASEIVKKLWERKLTQADLAKKWGISQPAVSKKLRKSQFSYEDIIFLFDFLEFSDEEIIRFTRLK